MLISGFDCVAISCPNIARTRGEMVDRLPCIEHVSISDPLHKVVWLAPYHLIVDDLLDLILLPGE